jgi:hypothetical protein
MRRIKYRVRRHHHSIRVPDLEEEEEQYAVAMVLSPV